MAPSCAVRLIGILSVLHSCWAYQTYPVRIPNGNNVPNPCNPEEKWMGVGHKLKQGTGARNPFGMDFAANGRQWTKELCMMDSDGDGMKNGEELGDPNCTWSEGDPDPQGTITHPGVCEPWNDPKCLDKDQDWIMEVCKPSKFEYAGLQDSHVQNMTMKFPRTAVPASSTVYHCQIFEMPKDQDYHMIATTPIIDNEIIMHHAVLFGCVGDVKPTTKPEWCGMVASRNCRSIISIWSVGSSGECIHPNAGFRIGPGGYTHLALQLHWNNPAVRSDFFDESGMTIHYTSQLRPNDAGTFTVGQENFLIPHRTPMTPVEATCPSECTQRIFKGNVHVTAVLNHMHYLGKGQYFELHRNGKKLQDVAVDRQYNYDNPKKHVFTNTIELRPGDALKTRCEFDSSLTDRTTNFGWGTHDEMCFTFITYFPKQNIQNEFCTSSGQWARCQLKINPMVDGCDTEAFPNLQDPETVKLYTDVVTKCPLFGDCTKPCYDAMQRARQHKCMHGEIYKKYIINKFFFIEGGEEFLMKLRICQCGLPPRASSALPDPNAPDPVQPEGSTCDWHRLYEQTTNHDLSLLFIGVRGNCVANGHCFHQCVDAVKAARAHKCYQGDEWKYGRWHLRKNVNYLVWEFLLDFESCNCEIQSPPTTPTPSLASSMPSGSVLMLFIFGLLQFFGPG